MKAEEWNHLVRRAINGDKEALNRVLIEKHKDIKHIALKYSSAQDAEDYAQEAMFRIVKNISQLQSPERFHKWMYAVVKNTCIYYCRKQLKRKNKIEITSYGIEDFDVLESVEETRREYLPEKLMEYKEQRDGLLYEIHALPQVYQDCLYLFYYRQMSYTEIAMELQTSEKYVGNNLMRAKKRLERSSRILR